MNPSKTTFLPNFSGSNVVCDIMLESTAPWNGMGE